MNGNAMTSEYVPEDRWAVLKDGKLLIFFKTEEEAWIDRKQARTHDSF